MSDNLHDLLATWFTTGLLSVQRVTWESPCEIGKFLFLFFGFYTIIDVLLVERVSEYEAVHPIRSWTDLKRRLGPYRLDFFHCALLSVDYLNSLDDVLLIHII